MKVKVSASRLCPTLYNPMDYSPPGSSVHTILQARILEWVAILFSRVFSLTQGITSGFPALQADSLFEPPEKPMMANNKVEQL